MPSETQKSISVYGFLMLATVVITAVIAFFLVPATGRDQKFWLSLVAIFAAEVFSFTFPITLMRREMRIRQVLPFHFGTGTMIAFYDVGVLTLCVISVLPVSFPVLLVAHLIWFLCFLILVGAATIGGNYIKDQQITGIIGRQAFDRMQEKLASLDHRLTLLTISDVAQIKKEFACVCEDANYLSRDSQPGSESVEMEINQCLDCISEVMSQIEVASTSPSGKDSTFVNAGNSVESIQRQICVLRQLFTKRDALQKRLRQIKG